MSSVDHMLLMPPIATGDAWLPLAQMDEDAIVTKMEAEYTQMLLSIHSAEYPILGIIGQRTNHDIDDPDPDDDGLEEEEDELLDGEEEEDFETDDVQG